jgi:hypothetical protein
MDRLRPLLCLGYAKSVDGEVGAVHAAQVATATFLRSYDVRRVISLGIEG